MQTGLGAVYVVSKVNNLLLDKIFLLIILSPICM